MLKRIEERRADGRAYDAPASFNTSAERYFRIAGVNGSLPADMNVPCVGQPTGKYDYNWYHATPRISSINGARESGGKRQT